MSRGVYSAVLSWLLFHVSWGILCRVVLATRAQRRGEEWLSAMDLDRCDRWGKGEERDQIDRERPSQGASCHPEPPPSILHGLMPCLASDQVAPDRTGRSACDLQPKCKVKQSSVDAPGRKEVGHVRDTDPEQGLHPRHAAATLPMIEKSGCSLIDQDATMFSR